MSVFHWFPVEQQYENQSETMNGALRSVHCISARITRIVYDTESMLVGLTTTD